MCIPEFALQVGDHKAHVQNRQYKLLPHVEVAASAHEQLSNRPRLSLKNQLVDYP